MKVIKRLNSLEPNKKLAIYASLIVVTIFILTMWKQGIFAFGLTGSSGSFMPLLHHSRWGAVMALVGSFILFRGKKKYEIISMILIIVGLLLIIQHLATEQCFSVVQSLLTPEGKPIGGFC